MAIILHYPASFVKCFWLVFYNIIEYFLHHLASYVYNPQKLTCGGLGHGGVLEINGLGLTHIGLVNR